MSSNSGKNTPLGGPGSSTPQTAALPLGPQHALPPPASSNNGYKEAPLQFPTRHWYQMTRTIAHYERLEQIGEGTYGQVYRARCKDTNQIVALKKIRVHHGKDWGMPPTVIREIKILKRLQHPNLVRMLEVVSSKGVEHLDEEDESTDERFKKKSKDRVVDAREGYKGNLFLVLEYVSHDLTGLMDVAYKFTPVQVKCVFRQLLEALQFMHQNKFVHRDIKSSNILLDHHFRVKLADFGLARCIEPPILDNLHDRASSQEFTNKVITLWYRPPEILMGATKYGPPVDVWSAGCILAELLLGKPLFTGKTEMDQLQLIFDLLGTPSPDTWDGLNDLKLLRTGQVTIPTDDQRKLPKLRAKYGTGKKIVPSALNLLEKLLELDPGKRLTASRALDSRYFLSDPVAPVHPEDLGPIQVHDHFHEFQTKKKRRQAKAEAEIARDNAKAAGMNDEEAQEQFDSCYRKLMKKVAAEGIDAFGSSSRDRKEKPKERSKVDSVLSGSPGKEDRDVKKIDVGPEDRASGRQVETDRTDRDDASRRKRKDVPDMNEDDRRKSDRKRDKRQRERHEEDPDRRRKREHEEERNGDRRESKRSKSSRDGSDRDKEGRSSRDIGERDKETKSSRDRSDRDKEGRSSRDRSDKDKEGRSSRDHTDKDKDGKSLRDRSDRDREGRSSRDRSDKDYHRRKSSSSRRRDSDEDRKRQRDDSSKSKGEKGSSENQRQETSLANEQPPERQREKTKDGKKGQEGGPTLEGRGDDAKEEDNGAIGKDEEDQRGSDKKDSSSKRERSSRRHRSNWDDRDHHDRDRPRDRDRRRDREGSHDRGWHHDGRGGDHWRGMPPVQQGPGGWHGHGPPPPMDFPHRGGPGHPMDMPPPGGRRGGPRGGAVRPDGPPMDFHDSGHYYGPSGPPPLGGPSGPPFHRDGPRDGPRLDKDRDGSRSERPRSDRDGPRSDRPDRDSLRSERPRSDREGPKPDRPDRDRDHYGSRSVRPWSDRDGSRSERSNRDGPRPDREGDRDGARPERPISDRDRSDRPDRDSSRLDRAPRPDISDRGVETGKFDDHRRHGGGESHYRGKDR